jgi:hypothetical protein
MSVIDPRGFRDDEVMLWADIMTGQLGFFSDPDSGSDENYERLEDPSKWQDWAMGVFGGVDALGQDVPDPMAYDNWKEWAERMFATSNFTG